MMILLVYGGFRCFFDVFLLVLWWLLVGFDIFWCFLLVFGFCMFFVVVCGFWRFFLGEVLVFFGVFGGLWYFLW